MPSCYYPELTATARQVSLGGDEFHHLVRVRRLRAGEQVTLTNGQGLLAHAELAEINKQSAILEIKSIRQATAREIPYAVAFALLKNKHDELLVEKCTELGTAQFYPMITDFGVRNEGKNTQNRLLRIAISAIKQCDNPFLPMVADLLPLGKALDKIVADGYQPVVCSELRPDQWMRDLAFQAPPCFMIGPEGGWSAGEMQLFASGSYPNISISRLITRAETAAIAAAAQFVALYD